MKKCSWFATGKIGCRLGAGLVCSALACGLAGTCPAAAASRDEAPDFRFTSTNVLDRVGDCHVTLEVTVPARIYRRCKTSKASVAGLADLAREFGVDATYAELEESKSWFDDKSGTDRTGTVVIEYVYRGFARSVGDDSWEAPLGENAAKMKLADKQDRSAIFEGAANSADLGTVANVMRVQIPPSARELKVSDDRRSISYRLSRDEDNTGDAKVDVTLDCRPRIMSCLANSYGDRRFNRWVARNVLKNTGDQALKNYRIRFCLADGYSSWSSWMPSAVVQPGQTVVDQFFPVFNTQKLNAIAAPSQGYGQPVTLKVEYEYQTTDETVRWSDTRQVRLLGPNEVVFSSSHDASYVLASFVTCNDPVMGQLAGHMSAVIEEARKKREAEEKAKNKDSTWEIFSQAEWQKEFTKALYEFMGRNGIACRNSSGGSDDHRMQFGRDVLRNKGGTDLDLTILYLSACESVGMRSYVLLASDHVFPAVRIDGELTAVDISMVGSRDYKTAVKAATDSINRAAHPTVINISYWHDRGYHSFELAPVGPKFLENLGYKFETQTPASHPRHP